MKIDLTDTTFVIPVRIDSIERFENINLILDYLYGIYDTKIIILEADKENNKIIENISKGKAKYIFVNDTDNIFHRTKYLNLLSSHVDTKYISIWDSDVIVHPSQILSSIIGLREDNFDFVFPYDGRFLDTGISHRINFFESRNIDYLIEYKDTMLLPYTSTACGGGFLARLSDYLACGGENENFYGWGQEDGERVERWKILEKVVRRIKGPMFHLYHPRGKNSNYLNNDHKILQQNEFNRICSMTKCQIIMEIKRWSSSRCE